MTSLLNELQPSKAPATKQDRYYRFLQVLLTNRIMEINSNKRVKRFFSVQILITVVRYFLFTYRISAHLILRDTELKDSK